MKNVWLHCIQVGGGNQKRHWPSPSDPAGYGQRGEQFFSGLLFLDGRTLFL